MASFFIGPIKLYSLSAQDVPGQMRKNQSLDGLVKSKHVWDFLLADQSHSNYGKSGYRLEVFFRGEFYMFKSQAESKPSHKVDCLWS